MRRSLVMRDWRLMPRARAVRDLLLRNRRIVSRIISSSRVWMADLSFPSARGAVRGPWRI